MRRCSVLHQILRKLLENISQFFLAQLSLIVAFLVVEIAFSALPFANKLCSRGRMFPIVCIGLYPTFGSQLFSVRKSVFWVKASINHDRDFAISESELEPIDVFSLSHFLKVTADIARSFVLLIHLCPVCSRLITLYSNLKGLFTF